MKNLFTFPSEQRGKKGGTKKADTSIAKRQIIRCSGA